MPPQYLSTARTPFFKYVPALLLVLVPAVSAMADTVWLDNGDRLSGTIKSLDAGFLLITTSYGGDMRIDFKHVSSLQSTDALVVRDRNDAREYRAKLVRAAQGKVALSGTVEEAGAARDVQEDIALSSLDSISRTHEWLGETSFKGKLDGAMSRTSSSTDSQVYGLALNTEVRHGLWRHRLSANYDRDRDNNSVSVNHYGGDYTLDRFLTKQTFWQIRGLYRRDTVEEVSRQIAYGTGPGYQFWDDELGAFSMSALAGRVHYRYDDGSGESSYAGALRWDYTRYLSGKKFELYTNGEVLRPFDAGAQISLTGEAGLRYKMNSWLSFYMKYAREQISGTRQTMVQSIYSTGVGVNW